MKRRTIKTVCSHDCPDACSVLVTVEEPSRPGDIPRAIRFTGDPDHPFTRGFLCGKVGSYEEIIHHPERLLYPLRRRGAKGDRDFERISWSEALETIAARLREAQEAHGGESIVQYFYAGTMGIVNRLSGVALFNRLGATTLRQNICFYGADAGYRLTVGEGYGIDPEDALHSDLILLWGANVLSTQVHLVPFLQEARRRGARAIAIDPYRNRTVRWADEWLQVRPGTDTALALSLLHVLEREALTDHDFIRRRTEGYGELAARILPRYPPEQVAEITGVPAERIETLARELAAAQAPLIKVGIGLGRSSHGAVSVRAICSLAGAVGAYEKPGGGVLYDSGCEFRLNLDAVTRPDWVPRPVRVLNMTDLGVALTEWDAPPLKVLYVHSSNPAATAPLQARVHEGLRRKDLFTVVHDRFLTDTACCADIVLPAVTFVETSDLYKSYGHLYLQYARQVMPPPGECRSNLEVIQALGRTLGFDDPWFEARIEDLVRQILATDHPNFRGLAVERLLEGQPFRLNLPRGRGGFAERFATPSGKLEFASRELAAAGLPALPEYRGDPFNERPAQYPLRLITPPAHAFLHSSFGASPRARRREGAEPRVLVNPLDARARGIEDGDEVEVSNDLGRVRLLARVTGDTAPGTVVAEGIWWPRHGRSPLGINALTSNRLSDLGGGSTFHDNRVALEKAGPA